MELRILYEDDSLVVISKPYGVLSEDSGSEQGMPALLSEQLGGTFYPVHRLDRTTCGLMVYARTSASAVALSRAIADGGFMKEYLAVVERETEPSGELCDLLYYDRSRGKSYVVTRPRRGVKEARLRYERLSTYQRDGRTVSLLRIILQTGRTHQIRVQFASRRHPLFGDRRYGSTLPAQHIALCCCALGFPHPVTGEEMRFTEEREFLSEWEAQS